MLRAVIVGIDLYEDKRIRSLKYARQDAQDFYDLLADRGHPSEIDLEFLVDEAATKRNVMKAIGDQLSHRAGGEDIVILYFACHGSAENDDGDPDASRFLIMHDSESDHLFGTAIDMDKEVQSLMHRVKHPVNVLMVIDSCFSGAAGGRTFESGKTRHQRTIRRGANDKISFKELDLGKGRVVFSACSDQEVALESAKLGHGVFTYYLLESLRKQRSEPSISLYTLLDEVTNAVCSVTGYKQTPVLNGISERMRIPSFS